MRSWPRWRRSILSRQSVNWSDPKEHISKYFTVREALWLPKWSRLASSGDGLSLDAQTALRALFLKLDLVREFIGTPITVHVAFRPIPYNMEIGGARESAHIARKEHGVLIAAVDWSADLGEDSPGANCDTLRAALTPKIAEWGFRMENNGVGAPWIHLDTKGPAGDYFLP